MYILSHQPSTLLSIDELNQVTILKELLEYSGLDFQVIEDARVRNTVKELAEQVFQSKHINVADVFDSNLVANAHRLRLNGQGYFVTDVDQLSLVNPTNSSYRNYFFSPEEFMTEISSGVSSKDYEEVEETLHDTFHRLRNVVLGILNHEHDPMSSYQKDLVALHNDLSEAVGFVDFDEQNFDLDTLFPSYPVQVVDSTVLLEAESNGTPLIEAEVNDEVKQEPAPAKKSKTSRKKKEVESSSDSW